MRSPVVCSLLLILLLPTSNALACATCLCGDPTLTTMGSEKPFAGRLRASVEYLTRSEITGDPQTSEHKIEEQRYTFSISYALNEHWIFAASLPAISKQVTRYDLSQERSNGLGDMDITARWFIGGDESFPARELWGLQIGVRLPTSTEQKTDARVMDFDAQPGAGNTIPGIGIWYGYYRTPWFMYLSAVAQHAIDEGYQGYRAGDALLLTAHTQYAPHYLFALQFSLDARWKQRDSYYGEDNADSGGALIMASPGISWMPVEDLIVNAAYQIPAADNLYGAQEEKAVLRMGLTYDF